MSEVIFNDKNKKPGNKILTDKIRKNFNYWEEIKKHVKEKYDNISEEWKFYGKNYGWQLKTFLKKRNLFFLIPYENFFNIVFVFGNKAVEEIEISKISKELIDKVVNAKKYAEGRGLLIEVKNKKYIADIKKLIEIKINN